MLTRRTRTLWRTMAMGMQVITAILVSSAASAGDFSERAINGFSPDGATFAFEEYGQQDGSGFPFSNIYFIDTATDNWVPDSPKRSLIRDESATIDDARGQARMMARFLNQQYRTTEPGNLVATQRYTHLDASPYRVTVNPRLVAPPIDNPVTIALDLFAATAQPYCDGIGFGENRGFRLTAWSGDDPAGAIVLHEDGPKVPKSRSCPLDYRIHDVITFFPSGGTPVLAVLIQIIGAGFEGPNGRFLAVTGALPQ